MLTRPFRPPEMPGLMPYLTVADPEKSMAFYQSAFNFKPATEPMLQDGKIMHAEMRFLDNRIMLGPVGAFGSGTASGSPSAPSNASTTTLRSSP